MPVILVFPCRQLHNVAPLADVLTRQGTVQGTAQAAVRGPMQVQGRDFFAGDAV